ncbi:MAG: hypothetical protein OXF85_00185, partial [Candidatus Saccharibacteria bacterium]|nr:hypothetical protein [Candidatus Saccharibacteria bacterium]
MNKKLIIILTSIIVLLVGVGITIYALTSDNEVKDEVKPADATKEVVECPKDTDTIKYSCNSDGNLISAEHYDVDGNLEWYHKYESDVDGNVIKQEIYDIDGNLEWYYQFEYDTDGNQIKLERYDVDG